MTFPFRENRSMRDRRRTDRRQPLPDATTHIGRGTIGESQSPKSLWDALDVARYLKVSRNWVYLQADAGRLPSVRIGGLRRFDPDKIRAFGAGEIVRSPVEKRK
jgi:excisionase family DNA binding protein